MLCRREVHASALAACLPAACACCGRQAPRRSSPPQPPLASAPRRRPLQNATWQLGAPLTSLLYGFRLVAAIVEQQLILGTVVVSSGLQIAGVCVTLAAVTAFMAWRWRAARLAGAA